MRKQTQFKRDVLVLDPLAKNVRMQKYFAAYFGVRIYVATVHVDH